MSAPPECALDAAVFAATRALDERAVPSPGAVLLSMTGTGLLPGRLDDAGRLPLEKLPGTPNAWREVLLHWGSLEGLPVWLLEDRAAPAETLEAPWERAWPVWLAAASGAATLVHCSAAASLGAPAPGAFAFARDHINLSGTTPLVGLGASRLGPMFPDLSTLHDIQLRNDALSACQRLGLVGLESVFACGAGPALETPAEQSWYRTAGADVSVQGLAAVLLAAAHAGLGVLAIGLVVAHAAERTDIARLAATAQRMAPAVDDLLVTVARSAAERAQRSLEEDPS